MAEVRTANATWSGDLVSGSGMITYVSSGVFSRLPVTWAARTSAHDGKTSPEELLAAAHAACFSMAFSARLGKNGTPPTLLEVKASVTFDQVEGGWKVTTSRIEVKGTVPGIDEETFDRLADDASENCPISVALRGNVQISVAPTLVAE